MLILISRSVKKSGFEATRHKWESHWQKALNPSDLGWLAWDARCTTIRLPIGYFTLGPSFCAKTPFDGEVAQVYVNAWPAVKDLVARCYSKGIGVLLDLHGLPGGANNNEHSGTTSNKAELWGNRKNLEHAKRCLLFMAQEVKNGMQGVTGIQLCNESAWEAPSKGMYEWYNDILESISHIDNTIPLYISDAWQLDGCIGYTKDRNSIRHTKWNPLIIDTHKYYTFSEQDRSQDPHQIISRIPGELQQLNGKDGNVTDTGAVTLFIGEYSNVLDTKTWARVQEDQKPELTNKFGQAQSIKWQERTGGSTFWTYKMDWMPGGAWGFKDQVKKGAIIPPYCLTLSANDVTGKLSQAWNQRDGRRDAAFNSHTGYWNQTSPGQVFEHERYKFGWEIGWNDAAAFFGARKDQLFSCGGWGGDKIGCMDVWVRKRINDAEQSGGFVWEFEQGYRKGNGDFYQAAQI